MTTRSGGPPLYRPLVILVVCVLLKVNAQESSCYNEWQQCVNGEIGKQTSSYLCDLIFLAFGECAKPLTCQEDLASQFSQLIGDYSCTNTDQVSPTASPCLSGPCLNGASCVVQNNKFVCLCQIGFVGELCEIKTQEHCSSNPCKNFALCRDNTNGFDCICQGGFTGKYCEITPDLFEPVTRPITTTPTTVPYAGCTCINGYCSNNGYCVCYEGYTGQDCRTRTITTTTDSTNGVTSIVDGALECSSRILDCAKPISEFVTNGDVTNTDKICSLSYESIECMEKQESFCNQYMNISDSIRQAEQNFNTTCGEGKECLQLTTKCTSPSVQAANLIKNLQQNGQSITQHLPQICSLMNQSFECLNKNMQNVTEECRNTLEMARNSSEMSMDVVCNQCYYNPCLNQGSCVDLTTEYKCICTSPYYGKMCEFNKNLDIPCGSKYCQHGGWCGQDNNCQCLPGYEGFDCEIKIAPNSTQTPTWPPPTTTESYYNCNMSRCLNGGKCMPSGYCSCNEGFTGLRCQYTDYNSTTSLPVSMCNGGYCQNGASCWSSFNYEYCNCPQEFTGKYCENRIGDMTPVCVDQVYKQINISQISNITYFCSVQKRALACFDNYLKNTGSAANITNINYLKLKNLTDISCAKEPVSCLKTYVTCNRQIMEANAIKNNNPGNYDTEKVCSLYNVSSICVKNMGYNSTNCPEIILNEIRSLTTLVESSICSNDMNVTIEPPPMVWCNGGYCQNGGRCIEGRYCSCSAMYTGQYCDYYMTTTTSSVERCDNGEYCYNGGRCIGGIYCSCPVPYTGKYCESYGTTTSRPNECGCENFGTCYNGKCYCPSNWVGKYCEEYNATCGLGVEKVECYINPCLGQTCPGNPPAKCVVNDCGDCDYMFIDQYGIYNRSCRGSGNITDIPDRNLCTNGLVKCANEIMMNHTATDIADPDMYCSINSKTLECYERLSGVCPDMSVVLNSSKQMLNQVCGPEGMPDCFRTLLECFNSSLPMISNLLQHPSSSLSSVDSCSMMNQTTTCLENYNFNASECPAVILNQIGNMTAIYDRSCGEKETCDTYNCNSGKCYTDGYNQPKCYCESGYYGPACDVNVCDFFSDNPCGDGNCTGKVEVGVLCSCPYYREGVLCEVNDYERTIMECPKIRRFAKYMLEILEGRQSAPSELSVPITAVFSALNSSWYQLPNCTVEGYYSGLIAEFNIYNTSIRNYYCVDKYGYRSDSSVGYSTPPNCQALSGRACESSPCQNGGKCQDYYQGVTSYYTCNCRPGYYGKQCEISMCDSFEMDPCSLNGGECVGDINSGRLCSCPDGRMGPLCDQVGDDWNKTDCQRLHELTVEMERFLNGSKSLGFFNARDMILNSARNINLTSMFLPICDEKGWPTNVECDVQIKNTSQKACYCVNQWGQRDSVPHYNGLPNCTRNHTGSCPPGIPVYACLTNPCQVTKCQDYPYAYCKANYCGGCNAEFYINDTRVNCSQPDTDNCPPGVPIVMCFADPCHVTSCPRYPQAMCRSNYCGGCNADFFMNGRKVNCTEPNQDLSWEPPRIVFQSNRTEYFKLGDKVILACNTTGHNFSHVWYKDGVKVDYGFPGQLNYNRVSLLRNGSLLISGTSFTDEGRYQCKYGPVVGDYISLQEARIRYEYRDHQTVRVIHGESLKLTCKVGSSTPPTEKVWMVEDVNEPQKELVLNNRVTMDYEGNLYFVNVQLEDAVIGRKYICMAFNEPARMMYRANSYTIDIIDRTVPAAKFSTKLMWNTRFLVALQGEELRLKCIFSGSPAPFVSFRSLNDSRRTDVSPQSMYYHNELVIKNVTMKEAGEYECYANTEASSVVATQRTYVEVAAKPYFVEQSRDQVIQPGGVALIHCKAEGIPKPTVQWYINGTRLQNVSSLYRHGFTAETDNQNTLLILRHMRVYRDPLVVQCNVSNDLGYLWNNIALSFMMEGKTRPDNATRPGRCPPVQNGTMSIGIEECKVDTDCQQDSSLKCCFNGFGHQCLNPIRNETQATRPGRCPPVENGTMSIGIEECTVDTDCQQNRFMKCCYNGFGHQCRMPLTNMPSPRRSAPVIIAQSPATVYFTSKLPSMLYCKGEGENLRYTWYKDGAYFNFTDPRYLYRVIQNNGTIRNSETLKTLDEGVYQCKVSNVNGTAIGRYIELKLASFDNVIGPDTASEFIEIGAPTTLYCNMPRSEPKAKITWILMDSNTSRYAESKYYSVLGLSERRTMDTEGNLHFVNVEASDIVDDKSYVCMGYNSVANIRRFTTYYTLTSNFNVPARREPELQWASPREPVGIMGDPLSLKCIFSGYPTPEVEFERIDGKPLSGYAMKKSFGLELYFPVINPADAGQYRCFTRNRQIRKKRATNIRTFNVAVESMPYYDVIPKNVEAYENEDAVFICRAEGIPRPYITWYKNGYKIMAENPRFEMTGLNNEVLRVDKVRMSDQFVIQCNATNKHGSLLTNLYLHVRPRSTTRPGRCPPVQNGTMSIGIEECTVDTDCQQDSSLKCCSNGFGHQCMKPIRNETQESCYSIMGQCLNGGSCLPRNGSTYCTCPMRYVGDRCQTWRRLPCDSYPCQNGASCQDTSEHTYSCSCPNSWGTNCERPAHDNCTCRYNEKCVLKENCEVENGRYYNCKVTKQCLLNSVYDPCIATTCPRNSECYIDVKSQGRCSCRKGFSGTDCSINDEVCNRFMSKFDCALEGKGNCVGDLENGVMCSCREGVTGPFCQQASTGLVKSRCEKKKEFYDVVLSENSTRAYLVQELMNTTWIPMVNCTPEGYFTPKQCFRKSYGNNSEETYCKCVNSKGDVLSDVKTYPGHDACTVPDSRTETARRICSLPMANDLCWNGGRCKGDIFNGKICECSPGYSGLFCHKRGNEEVDEQSLCQLNQQAFNLISRFTNSSGNFSDYITRHHGVDETARRYLSILEVYLRDPMRFLFNDTLVPMANCTSSGNFAPVQCVYNVTDMSVDACYCAMRNGTVIPGTRVMSPNRPTCERDENICESLESCPLHCENGYQNDMSDCPICACKSPCAGKVCATGHTCHVERRGNCSHSPGSCHTAVCVPENKDGHCPDYQHSNMTDIINRYLTNYECNNQCRNDSDCSGDMVCCGMSCGSQCMKPLGKGMCTNDKWKMKQEIEVFKIIKMLLNNQSALRSIEPLMVNMMSGFISKEIKWKPTCLDDDTYTREQCYFNYTGIERPVYCQCMTSNGNVVHNSRTKVDNSTISLFNCDVEKPGICPNVENGTFGIAVELCSGDYDCNGVEKCCSNGAGHVCKQPVPIQSGHIVIPNICKYQELICQSVDKLASCIGDWENGNICSCNEKSGLLCKQKYTERKMTGCEQREKLHSILYNVTHKKPVEPGYNEIVTFIKSLRLSQAQGRKNMTMTMPKCHMTDGSYRNFQCDQYLFTNKTKECYCVNERGHKFLNSEFKPDQEPKCTGYQNPDTVCRSGMGSPLGNGKSYVQCNANSGCPHGYECNYGRVYTSEGGYYTDGYCCLKHTALESRCNITVDRGVREQKCRSTRYYYSSEQEKCVKYNSSKCGVNHHKVNSFDSLQDCNSQCMNNIKSGSCPRKPPMYAQTSNCKDQCKQDSDCSRAYKCCETSCAKRCIVPQDIMDKEKACEVGVTPLEGYNCGRGGSQCPDGYYCDIAPNDGYAGCCPDKPLDICSMKKDPGMCFAYIPRWFMNSASEQCEQFIWGGCGGNDNNFNTREECCNSCGGDRCKEGQCPTVEKSIFASCDVKCKTDADCSGGALCCSNGCGQHCVTPTKNAGSSCFRELEKVNLKLSNRLMGQCSTMMIPRCNMDGSWSPEQCMENYGLCWCVTKNGTKVPDTTVNGRAQCGFTPRPGSGVPDPVNMLKVECAYMWAKITWEAPRNNNGYPVDQYLVEYRVQEDLNKWYRKKQSPNTFKTEIRLEAGMAYTFRVRARNQVGLSSIVEQQKAGCETSPGRPLSNPTNITSITNKHGYLVITWDPIPVLHQGHPYSLQYIVTVMDEGASTLQTPTIRRYNKDSLLVFEMPTDKVFSNFTVKIQSRNNLGDAVVEALVHRVKSFEDTPLVIPEILAVEKIVYNSAMLTWEPIAMPDVEKIRGVFHGFTVRYWTTDPGFENVMTINVTSGNTVELKNLVPDTGYEVYLAVRNTHYIGQPSPSLDFRTLPGPIDKPLDTNSTYNNMTSDTTKTDDMNICPVGESVHCCSGDLCKMAVCPAHPSAVCRVNPCGGCSVVFYDYDNSVVNCTKGLSMCEKRRHAAVKARYQHAFNNMTNMYPIVVIGNKTILTNMQDTPSEPMSVGMDPVCQQKPITGMCRAYFPRWYYNSTTSLCEKFIYGGCGGNDNNFERPEECYKRCSPEDSPCMNMEIPCADNEVCQIVTNPDCHQGACRQAPQCIRQHADPHLKGVYVPDCSNDKNYKYKQCHHGYCWCVTKDGDVFNASVTRGPLTCSESGPVSDPEFDPEVCTNGSPINMDCLDVCQGKLCPDHPDATCAVDLCSTDCKVKFLNKTNHEVACGSDICKVISDKPHKDCVAPVVCPGQLSPKICPVDVCDKASCYGNPCALCSVDPCTCKPVFVDVMTNITITDCSSITHTMCRMDYCNQLKDQNRAKSMGQDSDIILPSCDSTGRYDSKQCDSDTCWCVDGKGQWTKDLKTDQDSCSRNETLEVTVEMKFQQDFSKVENNMAEFEEAVLELMKKWNIDQYVKSITISAGSVLVETKFGSEEGEQPSPILSIIPDMVQNRVVQQDAVIEWQGEEWKADSEYFVVNTKYEKQTGEQTEEKPPESTEIPYPTLKPSGMDEKLIIVISVICAAIGIAILSVVVWACCCRKPVKKEVRDTFFTDMNSDRSTPPPPFGVSNQTYMTNNMINSNQYIGDIKPTLHTFGDHNKPVEEEGYDNDVIKVKM